MRTAVLVLVLLAGLVATPGGAAAQATASEQPIEAFIQHVTRLWVAGDVAAIVELLPGSNRVLLDTGSGTESANDRHAAAALRALFASSETTGARPVRATLASASPSRGFGEVLWTFRSRGSPAEQSRSIYVAALFEEGAWRISELRVMP